MHRKCIKESVSLGENGGGVHPGHPANDIACHLVITLCVEGC